MAETVIEIERLCKCYGHLVAVDDVSFTVGRGEIFGLLGLNGAGKTTTVECVQGLRRPDSGTVRVLGLDPQKDTRELRRRIGSQLQESALPDRIKVWEALDLFSSLDREPKGAEAVDARPAPPGRTRGAQAGGAPVVIAGAAAAGATGEAAESRLGLAGAHSWEPLLDQWGLSAKRRSSFTSLSGGQRQRLFVALALVNQPKIVFLDEMTTGLDPAARRVAWDLIRAIRDRGTTVVLVTHFMDEAEELCDRVAIMKGGRIIALDSPQGLIAAHSTDIRVHFGSQGASFASFSWLRDLPRVDEVAQRGSQVVVRGSGPVVALVASALVARGLVPSDLQVRQPTLEDVFLKLAGDTGSVSGEE